MSHFKLLKKLFLLYCEHYFWPPVTGSPGGQNPRHQRVAAESK